MCVCVCACERDRLQILARVRMRAVHVRTVRPPSLACVPVCVYGCTLSQCSSPEQTNQVTQAFQRVCVHTISNSSLGYERLHNGISTPFHMTTRTCVREKAKAPRSLVRVCACARTRRVQDLPWCGWVCTNALVRTACYRESRVYACVFVCVCVCACVRAILPPKPYTDAQMRPSQHFSVLSLILPACHHRDLTDHNPLAQTQSSTLSALYSVPLSRFSQDLTDHNPLVRALALRTMGCIRVEKIAEFMVEPVMRAIKVCFVLVRPYPRPGRLFFLFDIRFDWCEGVDPSEKKSRDEVFLTCLWRLHWPV